MSRRNINADEFVEVTWINGTKQVGRPEYEVLRHANNVPVSDVSFDEIVEYFIKDYERKNENSRKNKLKIISISKYKKVESKSFC